MVITFHKNHLKQIAFIISPFPCFKIAEIAAWCSDRIKLWICFFIFCLVGKKGLNHFVPVLEYTLHQRTFELTIVAVKCTAKEGVSSSEAKLPADIRALFMR